MNRAFQEGLRAGIYTAISEEVVRPSPAEVRDNSRATPAKLRWAVKSGADS